MSPQMTPAPMSDGELRAILDGCEGVTPGPWAILEDAVEYRPRQKSPFDDRGATIVGAAMNAEIVQGGAQDEQGGAVGVLRNADAHHIARLDPDTVKAIVTELLALRAPRKEQGAEPVAYVSEAIIELLKSRPSEYHYTLLRAEPGIDKKGNKDLVVPVFLASPNGGREERDEWQPIKTAVKDSHSRMVWCPERQNIYIVTWDPSADPTSEWTELRTPGWSHFGGGRRLMENPTHWRPLPDTPALRAQPHVEGKPE